MPENMRELIVAILDLEEIPFDLIVLIEQEKKSAYDILEGYVLDGLQKIDECLG